MQLPAIPPQINRLFQFIFVLAGFFVITKATSTQLYSTSSIFIVLFAIPSYLGLIAWVGVRRALATLAILSVLAIFFEALSITTGIPYGKFTYSSAIGFPLFDLVPWTVPFAWIPLVIASAALYKKPLAAAGFLVLVDLLLDPMAVALGFWTWQYPGAYYAIPFSNFVGWLITGLIGATIIQFTSRGAQKKPDQWTLVSLQYILLFWIAAALTAGFVVPAVCGGFALFLARKHAQKNVDSL
jgi:bisanhydrobacterioruberin hydratase